MLPPVLKSLIFLIGAAIAAMVWLVRRENARKRLQQVESGGRCVACDGTDLTPGAGTVRCNRCGYTASLERIRAVQLKADDVDNLVKPDDWNNS
jgi:hypothetical protein